MTKITAFRIKNPEARCWTDKFDYETGPTINMESESLNDLPQVLKNVWAKNYDWVEIETDTSIMKFSRPYISGGDYSAIFGEIKEKK